MSGKLFDADGNLISEYRSQLELLRHLGIDAFESKTSELLRPAILFRRGIICIPDTAYVYVQVHPYDKINNIRAHRAPTRCPHCLKSYDLKITDEMKEFESEYINLIAPVPGVYSASYHICCHALVQFIHQNSIYWKYCPDLHYFLTILNGAIFSYYPVDNESRPDWSKAGEVLDWLQLAVDLGLTIEQENEGGWEDKLLSYIKGGM